MKDGLKKRDPFYIFSMNQECENEMTGYIYKSSKKMAQCIISLPYEVRDLKQSS